MEENIKNQIIHSMVSNKLFELILMPTEQCNFRCSYCYEDFTIGRMKQNVIDGVKHLIYNRSSELAQLKISWFGGEPLSAKSIVYDISTYAHNLSRQQNFQFDGSMTTNGYNLSTTVMERLLSQNISSFQISLDGPRDVHDKTRLRINKTGSFDRIWQNLLALRDSELKFTVIIRVHLTRENQKEMHRLVDAIGLHFANDDRFCVFFKAIENLGGPNSHTIDALAREEQKSIINNLKVLLVNKVKLIELSSSGLPNICYAAQANSLLIRADGRIGKCTVALNSPVNTVGQLESDGTIKFDNARLAPWLKGIATYDLNALACPLSQMHKS